MTAHSASLSQEILAALALHQQWGVDGVMEDIPWDVWEETPSPVAKLQKSRGQGGSVHVAAPIAGVRKDKAETAQPAEAQVVHKERIDFSQARNIAELVQQSQKIEGISLARTAMHHLVPVFVEEAPFLLVGDVPNADEDRSGQLFAGQGGILLDKILASIGVQKEQLHRAPAIPWRPPGGQRVSKRELDVCLPILHRIISLCSPVRIVTMGVTPAQMLLRTSSRLAQLRGRWHDIEVPGLTGTVPVLPLLHPLQLEAGPKIRENLWKDMLLLAETLDGAKESANF